MAGPFFFLSCHKRLDGVFDKVSKESMAGHLLCSPLLKTRQNESRVDLSLGCEGAVIPVRL